MGGAFTCLALGANAPFWNPANLSLSPKSDFSMNVFAFGAYLKNNSFTRRDYNHYNGAYLDSKAKKNVLDLVSPKGLTLDARAGAQFLSFAYGPMAFSSTIISSGKVQVDKELFDLILFGNERNRQYNFQPANGDAITYSSFAFSFSLPINTGLSWMAWEGVGVSIKYLRGFQYIKVLNAKAVTLTDFQGTTFHGSAILQHAKTGHGFGFDLGCVATIAQKYRIGIVLENVPAVIRWSKGTEETCAKFRVDSLSVERLQDVDFDSVIIHQDSVYAVAPFSKRLPAILKFGAATTLGDFIVTVDFEQGFRETALSDLTPFFALGTEWRRLKFLRLRSGISIGGYAGFALSWGMGLASGPVFFDIAIRTYNSPFIPWAQGIAFGTSLQLRL